MKKFSKLIPAFCMLLISAMLMGTSTFAWFSMNTQVTATGMQVKAQAEGGIVISNAKDGIEWKASATASNSTLTELIPTSTANATNWYHAVSDDAESAKKEQPAEGAYTLLSVTENAGAGNVSMGTDTKAIYLVNSFYIKSSTEAMTLTSPGLYINNVTVTLPGNQKTENLNKALRVAVVMNDGTTTVTKIFAPVSGGETSYKVNNTTTVEAIAAGTKNTSTNYLSIPAYSSTSPIEAKIYCYFEGEDENCKSANLAAVIDELKVSVQFGTTAIS